jgi:hypothetical protein
LNWRAGSQCDGVVVVVVSEHLAGCVVSRLVGGVVLKKFNKAERGYCNGVLLVYERSGLLVY